MGGAISEGKEVCISQDGIWGGGGEAQEGTVGGECKKKKLATLKGITLRTEKAKKAIGIRTGKNETETVSRRNYE